MDIDPKGMNGPPLPLVRARLRTPRAAAVAGIAFSGLLTCSLVLLQLYVPSNPLDEGAWLATRARRVTFALNLIPFAGIAFLWFIGVLRDRLGDQEDKFFATVFLGSGLLFLGMVFITESMAGGLILVHSVQPTALLESVAFTFVRACMFNIMHIYAFRMAAVFMISASTLAIRTRITARWIALVGYMAALFLLFGSSRFDWVLLVFPAWVLLVSLYILADNLRGSSAAVSAKHKG